MTTIENSAEVITPRFQKGDLVSVSFGYQLRQCRVESVCFREGKPVYTLSSEDGFGDMVNWDQDDIYPSP